MRHHVPLSTANFDQPEYHKADLALFHRAEKAALLHPRPIHHFVDEGSAARNRGKRVEHFAARHPEIVRWFAIDGRERKQSLTIEELVVVLERDYGHTAVASWHLAENCSDALYAADANWFALREKAAPESKPLDGHEYLRVVTALDALYQQPGGKEFAVDAARKLGTYHSVYVPAQFDEADLCLAYLQGLGGRLESMARERRDHEDVERSVNPDSHACAAAIADRKAAEWEAAHVDEELRGRAPTVDALYIAMSRKDGLETWWNVSRGEDGEPHESERCSAWILGEAPAVTNSEVATWSVSVRMTDGSISQRCDFYGPVNWDMLQEMDVLGEWYAAILDGDDIDDTGRFIANRSLSAGM